MTKYRVSKSYLKAEPQIVSDITTTIIKNRNNVNICNKETISSSNHIIRNKTIANFSKHVLTILVPTKISVKK